ncbi:MAG: VOC family protein [Anaerolineales bacterium]|nr:VOC family protein [Anaerolineales bacterium]
MDENTRPVTPAPQTQPPLPLAYQLRLPRVRIARPPLLILLHTISGSEKDLMGLVDKVDERFLVLSLRAPFTQSPGKHIWFNQAIGGVSLDLVQAAHSREILARTINEAVRMFRVGEDDSGRRHVYLLGFGQGAVMALGLLVTVPQLLAGVVAISGMMLNEFQSLAAPPETLGGLPLLLMHGRSDVTYPPYYGRETSSKFSMLPVKLHYKELAMGHYLSAECIEEACRWLTEHLDEAGVMGIPTPAEYRLQIAGVQICVRNLERAIAFYTRFLGLRLVERAGKAYAFLGSQDGGPNTPHHMINLRNVGKGAPQASGEAPGIHRVRFEVPDQQSFAKAYQTLVKAGIPVNTIDRMVHWVVRFEDPDGNKLEIFWDARSLPGRPLLWQGRDQPLEAEKILALLSD